MAYFKSKVYYSNLFFRTFNSSKYHLFKFEIIKQFIINYISDDVHNMNIIYFKIFYFLVFTNNNIQMKLDYCNENSEHNINYNKLN